MYVFFLLSWVHSFIDQGHSAFSDMFKTMTSYQWHRSHGYSVKQCGSLCTVCAEWGEMFLKTGLLRHSCCYWHVLMPSVVEAKICGCNWNNAREWSDAVVGCYSAQSLSLHSSLEGFFMHPTFFLWLHVSGFVKISFPEILTLLAETPL